MKNTIASFAALTSASQFLCLFCCIVPTATAIIGLLSSLGLAGEGTDSFLADLSVTLHPWQPVILGVSLVLISLSWAMWIYSKKQAESNCGCAVKKPYFLTFATVLILFNSVSYAVMH